MPLIDWLILGGILTLGGVIFYAVMAHVFIQPLTPALLKQAISGVLNRRTVAASEEP